MTHEIMKRDFTVLLILPIKFMDFKWRHLPFVDLISLFFFFCFLSLSSYFYFFHMRHLLKLNRIQVLNKTRLTTQPLFIKSRK